MLDLEALYLDSDIDNYILLMAGKNLLSYDDMKQSIFLEAMETDCETMDDFMRACYRVRYRMKRDSRNGYHLSIPDNDIVRYNDDSVWKSWSMNEGYLQRQVDRSRG